MKTTLRTFTLFELYTSQSICLFSLSVSFSFFYFFFFFDDRDVSRQVRTRRGFASGSRSRKQLQTLSKSSFVRYNFKVFSSFVRRTFRVARRSHEMKLFILVVCVCLLERLACCCSACCSSKSRIILKNFPPREFLHLLDDCVKRSRLISEFSL